MMFQLNFFNAWFIIVVQQCLLNVHIFKIYLVLSNADLDGSLEFK